MGRCPSALQVLNGASAGSGGGSQLINSHLTTPLSNVGIITTGKNWLNLGSGIEDEDYTRALPSIFSRPSEEFQQALESLLAENFQEDTASVPVVKVGKIVCRHFRRSFDNDSHDPVSCVVTYTDTRSVHLDSGVEGLSMTVHFKFGDRRAFIGLADMDPEEVLTELNRTVSSMLLSADAFKAGMGSQ